jgi:hypothetical protein
MKHRPPKKPPSQATTFIALLLLLFIVFVSVGYFFMIAEPEVDPRRTELREQFERNRQLWASRRPVAFQYHVARRCNCTAEFRRPYRVTEGHGTPLFEYASPLAAGSAGVDAAPPDPLRIADLFALIEAELDSAQALDIGFDPAYGFPTRIDLDRSPAVDDELGIAVYDFQIIEYGR